MRRLRSIVAIGVAHLALSVSVGFTGAHVGLSAIFGGAHPILAPITWWLFHIFWFPLGLAGYYWCPPGRLEYILLVANSALFGIAGSSMWRWLRRRSSRASGA